MKKLIAIIMTAALALPGAAQNEKQKEVLDVARSVND